MNQKTGTTPEGEQITFLTDKKDICTMCWNSGWNYSVDPICGTVEDESACDRCPKGQAYDKLSYKKQEELFNDYLASLPELDVDEEE